MGTERILSLVVSLIILSSVRMLMIAAGGG